MFAFPTYRVLGLFGFGVQYRAGHRQVRRHVVTRLTLLGEETLWDSTVPPPPEMQAYGHASVYEVPPEWPRVTRYYRAEANHAE
jgi:hypothetical protein